MKRLLPKSVKNPSGFTLVELLVVVSIIAILSVIGLAVFTGVQKGARNARRQSDIDAISKTLETHYNDSACGASAALPYCPVTTSTQAILFSNGTIPSNPTPGGTAYSGLPQLAVATYNICATLETPPGGTFCRSNQQ